MQGGLRSLLRHSAKAVTAAAAGAKAARLTAGSCMPHMCSELCFSPCALDHIPPPALQLLAEWLEGTVAGLWRDNEEEVATLAMRAAVTASIASRGVSGQHPLATHFPVMYPSLILL